MRKKILQLLVHLDEVDDEGDVDVVDLIHFQILI